MTVKCANSAKKTEFGLALRVLRFICPTLKIISKKSAQIFNTRKLSESLINQGLSAKNFFNTSIQFEITHQRATCRLCCLVNLANEKQVLQGLPHIVSRVWNLTTFLIYWLIRYICTTRNRLTSTFSYELISMFYTRLCSF